MNRIECKHCRNVSLAFDNFMDLSVPIPRSGVRITGNVDLETCIKAFISPEKMEECGYKC
jgi:ubiquitin C-terminal hydrolase